MFNVRGDDLRRMRVRKRKTTKQMANYLGVSRATYENWENDVSSPKVNQFIQICAYCSRDISILIQEIIGRDDPSSIEDQEESEEIENTDDTSEYKG
ncbi:helix-turn-helix transcriptional regulator [Algicola sagamiensis]|uniref:helix-turn-helix transcriptional regulator n=1 Tax=Algicola sagamiensis TaxID=163869 RepID=UPI00035C181E|nr:helix-turn-helix transcriptional regulator [Algicola sagamiensis]